MQLPGGITVTKEASYGQIGQMVMVLFALLSYFISQNYEASENRAWREKFEKVVTLHSEEIHKLNIVDTESARDRQYLKENIDEIKRGQEKILDFIREK